MRFHFGKTAIAWLYHTENPSVLDPSIQRLARFDRDLAGEYEEILKEKMREAEIKIEPRTKSIILALAYVSNRQSSPAQVNDAIRFYVHLTKLPVFRSIGSPKRRTRTKTATS